MGHDIYARKKAGASEVAYLRVNMSGFRLMEKQGYDWYSLIGANECNGGVSGTGEGKYIKLKNLEKALNTLKKIKTSPIKDEIWGNVGDFVQYYKPSLTEFMNSCIAWCKENESEIYIEFR